MKSEIKMFKSLLTVVVVSLAITAVCEAICRFTDQIKPVSVDFDELAKTRLRYHYATENYSSNIDHAFLLLQKTDDNKYNATNVYIIKDGTIASKNYTIEYKDGVVEETYYVNNGFTAHFTVTSYILSKTDEGFMLVYLCSNSSAVYNDADMRYIIAPEGTTMSNESVNHLMAADRQFDFNSNLVKLPNQL